MIECPICHKLVERLTFRDSCSRSCHMRKLTAEGRYKGTNRIADWNRSEARKERISKLSKERHLIKGARGFNSEHSDRLRNYHNILNRESPDKDRFLYLLDFKDKLKVGSTSTFNRRMWTLSPDGILFLIKGKSPEIAKLEFDTLVKFEYYTLLNESGTHYTEFLDYKVKDEVIKYFEELLSSSTTIQKV